MVRVEKVGAVVELESAANPDFGISDAPMTVVIQFGSNSARVTWRCG